MIVDHHVLVGLTVTISCLAILYLLFTSGEGSSNNINGVEQVSVAFIGNSFQFVNDLPRFMEALSEGTIKQDSMLHGSLCFETMLLKGNGMYNKWQSSNALNVTTGYYDFGACTVRQLLLGEDSMLNDYENYYYDDGKNPCFQDESYLEYKTQQVKKYKYYISSSNNNNNNGEETTTKSNNKKWDYILLNDHSMRPAIPSKRKKSIQVLEEEYVDMIITSGAIPILLETWAYWRTDINMTTKFVDITTFSKRLHRGYQKYYETLQNNLPTEQQPLIAPVNQVFFKLYNDNYPMWKRLFSPEDKFHLAPTGTYLEGLVVYATIYNKLPPPPPPPTTTTTSATATIQSKTDDEDDENDDDDDDQSYDYYSSKQLFKNARKMQISGDDQPYPTIEEMHYLRWITKQVCIL